MRKRILMAGAVLCLAWAIQTARFYDGLNKGVVWDNGAGIELVGEPGLFWCLPLPNGVDC